MRLTLTPQTKALITRRHKHFNKYLNKGFVIRHVSNKRIKQLKENGFETFKNKAIIPTEGYDPHRIRIKGNKVKYISADKALEVILTTKQTFLSKLKSLSESKLPRGQFVTVRIGTHSPFRQAFPSFDKLMRYLTDWEPKDKTGLEKDDLKSELIDQMAIVKYFSGESNNVKKKKRKKKAKNPRSI